MRNNSWIAAAFALVLTAVSISACGGSGKNESTAAAETTAAAEIHPPGMTQAVTILRMTNLSS